MGNRDLPDIYAHALGPQARGRRDIYQANPDCPCYNLYIIVHMKLQYMKQPNIYCIPAPSLKSTVTLYTKPEVATVAESTIHDSCIHNGVTYHKSPSVLFNMPG